MTRRTFRVPVLLALALAFCACSGARAPYPPPAELAQAPLERQEFVDAFLQGRWCEAEMLFSRSVEGYLRADDFCAVAYSHYLAYELTSFAGETDASALAAAKRYRDMGLGCPGLPELPGIAAGSGLPAKDQGYLELIEAGDYAGVASRLAAEPDALYASVYARKAARAAGAAGNEEAAANLAHLARDVDARQGWVVFLVQDWTLIADRTTDGARRAAIEARIDELKQLIQPCEH